MTAKKSFDKVNRHGTNKLVDAIQKDKYGQVLSMVKQGADLDFRTSTQSAFSKFQKEIEYAPGSTPLHVACRMGRLNVVTLLLDENVDMNVKNTRSETPLDLAILSYHYHNNEYQKKLSAKIKIPGTTDDAFKELETFKKIIEKLVAAGAETSIFPLPESFTASNVSANKDIRKDGIKLNPF